MNLILAIVALFCLATAAVSADKRGTVSGKKRSSRVQPDDESGGAMMMKKTAVW